MNSVVYHVNYLDAMFLEFLLEFCATVEELALLGLVLLLDGRQLRLQLLLVHRQTLHLPLQHLKICACVLLFTNIPFVALPFHWRDCKNGLINTKLSALLN